MFSNISHNTCIILSCISSAETVDTHNDNLPVKKKDKKGVKETIFQHSTSENTEIQEDISHEVPRDVSTAGMIGIQSGENYVTFTNETLLLEQIANRKVKDKLNEAKQKVLVECKVSKEEGDKEVPLKK